MTKKTRSPLPPAIIAVVIVVLMAWMMTRQKQRAEELVEEEKNRAGVESVARGAASTAQRVRSRERAEEQRAAYESFKAQLAARLESNRVRKGEASLSFRDADALRRFLARAEAAGITVISSSDALLSARVRYSSVEALAGEIFDNAGDYEEVGGNYIAQIPEVPLIDERTAHAQIPVRNNLLGAIGVAGVDNSQWGRGVTIAVLDSGVLPDATFGQNRVRSFDVGYGTAPGQGTSDAHGTAVASLAAGASADAPGVAPSANILSIRVTDTDGLSDMYSIAQAIVAATDNGAQIINVSLGGYGGSTVLTRAIEYAMQNGAVVVAAAGNDQASQLVWPAANKQVISVGATDAAQQQVNFSNSGPQLQIAAPGYAIQVAWSEGDRINFTGTSASAPVVAGAIAALMSETPGMSAQQAWAILQAHTDDAGAQGRDSDYGAGVIDLEWAMARADTSRIDTAISSHYYDATNRTVDVVVQNRSGFGMAGMTLSVNANGASSSVVLPWLEPGASAVVKVPVTAGVRTVVRTTLTNPSGLADSAPANNSKTSEITLTK